MKKIKLTQGKYALVDNDDYKVLNQWKWQAIKNGNTFYARRSGWDKETKKKTHIVMHREIVGTPKGFVTDHVNGNGLDNRRSNLRACTHAENMQNQKRNRTGNLLWTRKDPRYKSDCWESVVSLNGESTHLGVYKTAEEAHSVGVAFVKQRKIEDKMEAFKKSVWVENKLKTAQHQLIERVREWASENSYTPVSPPDFPDEKASVTIDDLNTLLTEMEKEV